MTSLPKAFNYSQFKPVGFSAKNRIVRFRPQSSQYGSLGVNDTIRFQINTPGYWDPYHSYINIDIDVSDEVGASTHHFSQLDSSAHSFISEMVTYVKGTEVERIMDYDVLACILNDVHYSPEQRQSRMHEGLGFGNKNSHIPSPTPGSASTLLKYDTSIAPDLHGVKQIGVLASSTIGPRALYGNSINTSNTYGTTFEYYNSAVPGYSQSAYTKSTDNFPLSGLQVLCTTFYSGQWNPAGSALERADLIVLAQQGRTIDTHRYDSTGGYDNLDAAIKDDGEASYTFSNENVSGPVDVGSDNLYNYSLSNASFEPMFANVDQRIIKNGKIGQSHKVTKASFSIPIINGIFGILMPAESFRFIPMAAFENLILEFRMNKYALFTSGYIDGGAIKDIPKARTPLLNVQALYGAQTTQPSRNYRITKFEIVAELVEFDSGEIDSLTNSQLDSGIILHTNSWFTGPYFYLKDTAAVNGTFQINLSFESMKAMVFCFLSEDHKNYSFCRKNYRLSRNITYMQFKVGVDYYPSQPIEGHGGNPVVVDDAKGTNSEFLINLYKTFGKLHDTLSDNFISNVNFAVNERPYDVTNTDPLLRLTDGAVINGHTAMGMPGYWENACVGRSVYGMNFETLNNDMSFISGINTTKVTPFELALKTDSGNVDLTRDRPATMYIFCLYDFLVSLTKTGVRVIGRG